MGTSILKSKWTWWVLSNLKGKWTWRAFPSRRVNGPRWVKGVIIWISMFPSLITQFPLLITQFPSLITKKWWDLRNISLFGFVFWICFHYSILTYFSNELQKLETSFRCFWVMEIKLWWHFRNFTQLIGPMFVCCQIYPTPQQLSSFS